MTDLSSLSTLQNEILSLQKDWEEKKKEAEDISAVLEEKKSHLLKVMVAGKIDNFKTDLGMISLNRRFQVKTPKGDDLDLFFAYLGETEPHSATALRTINYQTLQGWFKEKLEAAGEMAPFLKIPGLEPPSCNEYLSIRAKKA